jgi:hypothetical protein
MTIFARLHTLKAGENHLPMAKLGNLPILRKLSLPCNEIDDLDLDMEGKFKNLEV